MFASHHIVKLA